MKERPIIFSGPMIPAILDDRKTVTRRVIKPQPELRRDICPTGPTAGLVIAITEAPGVTRCLGWKNFADEYCPYGKPGMNLWVREAWAPCIGGPCEPGNPVLYRADVLGTGLYEKLAWRPSIHMFRWASRILLEVTSVRVERVQDITRLDIAAEGWPTDERQQEQVDIARALIDAGVHEAGDDDENIDDASIEWFADLWDSLNAKPKPRYKRNEQGRRVIAYYVSYPWEDIQETREHRGKPWYVCGNPFVWPITFKRLPDIASLRRGSG